MAYVLAQVSGRGNKLTRFVQDHWFSIGFAVPGGHLNGPFSCNSPSRDEHPGPDRHVKPMTFFYKQAPTTIGPESSDKQHQ